MPELPEVEIARRTLTQWLQGRTLLQVETLDPAVWRSLDQDAAASRSADERLRGLTLRQVRRRAKVLVLDFGPLCVVAHLKMTGKFVRTSAEVPRARIRFVLAAGPPVCFDDVRRLGWLALAPPEAVDAWFAAQGHGPEPYPDPLSVHALSAAFARTRRRIKDVLLDQRVIAGLGNIAASEVLWRAGVDPVASANTLDAQALEKLGAACVWHIERTIALEEERLAELGERGDGAITYLSEAGAYNPFMVYGRAGEPCSTCGATVEKARHGQRVTYFCPQCQLR